MLRKEGKKSGSNHDHIMNASGRAAHPDYMKFGHAGDGYTTRIN